jgi:hypothetical protein
MPHEHVPLMIQAFVGIVMWVSGYNSPKTDPSLAAPAVAREMASAHPAAFEREVLELKATRYNARQGDLRQYP